VIDAVLDFHINNHFLFPKLAPRLIDAFSHSQLVVELEDDAFDALLGMGRLVLQVQANLT
jgi:hypothetical protein